MIHTQHAALSN
jgi:hypothetical protein